MPRIKGLNFNADNAFIVEPSVNTDTITYWLRDSALVDQDTLNIQLQYRMTDSRGHSYRRPIPCKYSRNSPTKSG